MIGAEFAVEKRQSEFPGTLAIKSRRGPIFPADDSVKRLRTAESHDGRPQRLGNPRSENPGHAERLRKMRRSRRERSHRSLHCALLDGRREFVRPLKAGSDPESVARWRRPDVPARANSVTRCPTRQPPSTLRFRIEDNFSARQSPAKHAEFEMLLRQ